MSAPTLPTATLALVLASAPSRAEIVIGTETFEYSDTAIAGKTGGSGWDYQRSNEGHANGASDFEGGATVTAGRLVTGSNAPGAREYSGTTEGSAGGSGEREGAFRGMGSFFYGVDLTVTAFQPGNASQFVGISSMDFGTERVLFGIPGGQADAARKFGINQAGGMSGIDVVEGMSYRLVAQVDFDADRVRLWINPDGGDFLTPDAEAVYTSSNWSSRLRLASGGSTSVQAFWDNLIVTTKSASEFDHCSAFIAAVTGQPAPGVAVDGGTVGADIGGQASGTTAVDITPIRVEGWANWGGAALVPNLAGGKEITLSQLGMFTLSSISNNRVRQKWGDAPAESDTSAIRAQASDGWDDGEGFKLAFVPNAAGPSRLRLHLAEFGLPRVAFKVKSGGLLLASGDLPGYSLGSSYDEGVVDFLFHPNASAGVGSAVEIELTRAGGGSGSALAIGAAWIEPVLPGLTFPARPALQANRDLGRLLCIGDSITEGNAGRPDGEGNWSWRQSCWQNFIEGNVDHEFVGTRTANRDGASYYPPHDGASFLNRHEAISGTTFLERSSNAPVFLGSLMAAGKTPDTAVIFGGGNDLKSTPSISNEAVRDRTKSIIDQLQGDVGTAGNGNIDILVVSILPRMGEPLNGRYREINQLVKTLCTGENTPTSSVKFLDVYDLFDNRAYFYDGVHLNGKGEQLLGNAIFAALVPDLPAVDLRLEVLDPATDRVGFHVRSHGPRRVRIETSADLSTGSWEVFIPAELNPGEWSLLTGQSPQPLRAKSFYRAVPE